MMWGTRSLLAFVAALAIIVATATPWRPVDAIETSPEGDTTAAQVRPSATPTPTARGFGLRRPVRGASSKPAPPGANPVRSPRAPNAPLTEQVSDGGFEAGSPWSAWTTQTSDNFGTLLCSVALCGGGASRSGAFFAWFGGTTDVENASIGQDVVIPAGSLATLSFYLWLPDHSGTPSDSLQVLLDGAPVFAVNDAVTTYNNGYTKVTLNVTAAAGGVRNLLFVFQKAAGANINIFVDDISLDVTTAANDTCATATPLTLNTALDGTTVSAANDYQLGGAAAFTGLGQTPSTAPGRDVVYSFVAPAAGSYTFHTRIYSDTQNLVLYVATSCPAGIPPITVGTAIKAANRQAGSGANGEAVDNVTLTTGQTVFAFVDDHAAGNVGSAFTIEVRATARESEPNNTPATGQIYVFGVEGAIGSVGDVDFYGLGSPPAGSRVFALVDADAANDADFDLRVTTTTDTLEYDDQNNSAPFGGLGPNVAGGPTAGGQTYLRVNRANDTGTSEPYWLYAVVQPPLASATAEVENQVAGCANNATLFCANTAPNNYFLGGLATAGDVDLYRFSATAGELIFVSLDSDPLRNNTPFDAALALLDPGGNQLVAVNDADGSANPGSGVGSLTASQPSSPGEALIWRARYTGEYFVRISSSAGSGDYLLSISRNGVLGSPPISLGDLKFLTNPVRVVDTRPLYANNFSGQLGGVSPTGFQPNGAPIVASAFDNGETRRFKLAGQSFGAPLMAIPAGATGALINVTVIQPPGAGTGGFTVVYPGDANAPNTATVNPADPVSAGLSFAVNQNFTVVGLAAITGTIAVTSFGQPLARDVVIDLVGYYAPSNSATVGQVKFIPPVRVLDTRPQYSATGDLGGGLPIGYTPAGAPIAAGPIAANVVNAYGLANRGFGSVGQGNQITFPAGVTGILAHITTIQSPGLGGFTTLLPGDAGPPGTATLNPVNDISFNSWANGIPTSGPNAGAFGVYSTLSHDVVVDVMGYFLPTNPPLTPTLVNPIRVVDTRGIYDLNGNTSGALPIGFDQTGAPITAGPFPASDTTRRYRLNGKSFGYAASGNQLTFPVDGKGALMNVSSVQSAAPTGGFLTVFPGDASPAGLAATVNPSLKVAGAWWASGLPNSPAANPGTLGVFSTGFTRELIIDVSAYFR